MRLLWRRGPAEKLGVPRAGGFQVMGGEGFMTENEVERLWRDSRINSVVEGANEVMHSFVFAYGSKQLGEHLMGIRANPMKHLGKAMQIGAELFLGIRRPAPAITKLHPRLAHLQRDLEQHIREFSHQIKMMFKIHEEKLVTDQAIQERLSWCAIWIYGMACVLSRADKSLRGGTNGTELENELKIVEHTCAIATDEINIRFRALRTNTDKTMRPAAQVALRSQDHVPNSEVPIPESTKDMDVRGKGKQQDQTHIRQFGEGTLFKGAPQEA